MMNNNRKCHVKVLNDILGGSGVVAFGAELSRDGLCIQAIQKGGARLNLTFEGFLKGYCRELSGQQSLSFRKLVKQATTVAPRVAEPLFCSLWHRVKPNTFWAYPRVRGWKRVTEAFCPCTPKRVAWHLYAPRINFLIVMPTLGVRIER